MKQSNTNLTKYVQNTPAENYTILVKEIKHSLMINGERRLVRVPWTARRSNQSILKEVSPGISLEGMLKVKLQYFGHLM